MSSDVKDPGARTWRGVIVHELYEALEHLVADVEGHHPEACTGSERLEKAKAVLESRRADVEWIRNQGG
jgi:hypothetical protein